MSKKSESQLDGKSIAMIILAVGIVYVMTTNILATFLTFILTIIVIVIGAYFILPRLGIIALSGLFKKLMIFIILLSVFSIPVLAKEIVNKELIESQYGSFGYFGIGDRTYKVTYNDGSIAYQYIEGTLLSPAQAVYTDFDKYNGYTVSERIVTGCESCQPQYYIYPPGFKGCFEKCIFSTKEQAIAYANSLSPYNPTSIIITPVPTTYVPTVVPTTYIPVSTTVKPQQTPETVTECEEGYSYDTKSSSCVPEVPAFESIYAIVGILITIYIISRKGEKE